MNVTHLLLGGVLAAGLLVVGDDHLTQLMKKLHGGGQEVSMGGEADLATLGVLHEAIGRMDLDEARRSEIHEKMAPQAVSAHASLDQVFAARDAQVRAVFALPFDAAALERASQSLADAQSALARSSAELHA